MKSFIAIKTICFEYRLPTKHPKLLHNFTVPISSNGLFKFCTKTGYTSFMRHASRLQPSFKYFCGTSHSIPSGGDDIFDYCRHTTTSPNKTRENNVVLDKPRENLHSDPLKNFVLKSTLVSTVFHSNTPDILHEDNVTASYRRKKKSSFNRS